ncbi:MAG: CAP domain-containing protein [Actinobacteria bacterium]|nr:CAP domain-containing protein [Actinomycetota bacterium]
MASHGFMGHVGSDGSTFVSRANGHGYVRWNRVSENVAAGQRSVEEVLADWLRSSGHVASILDPWVNHAGFARVDNHWTQDFGANGTC